MARSGWTATEAWSTISSAETSVPTLSTPPSVVGSSGRFSSICRRRSSVSPMLRPMLAGSSTASTSGACQAAWASTIAPIAACARGNDPGAERMVSDGGFEGWAMAH
ncbi:MAG: hypothetical protein ABJA74_05680 [Lapillicoccus sp.]